MAQNSQALDLAEAINQLKSEIKFQPGKETLPLEGALERILAAPVHAPLDMPPFPASAMDGYALRRLDFQDDPGRAFRVVGQSLAGHPYAGKVGSGEAVRIFTGAVVPTGADQIILQEELAQQLDEDAGQTRVQFKPHQPGESYVRPVAHDVAHGAQVASPGEVLNPFLFGALTSYGVSQVEVVKPIRVGVFSTGDELVPAGTPAAELQPGQIYDSNRATVLALLRNPNLHINDLGRIADDADQTREFLTRASADCDVLITSGGVSVGEADFVTRSIAELGRLNVWKLNLKPGKPMAVGSIGGCTIFGLPGNPVSTVVTLLLVARPLIFHMLTGTIQTPLRYHAELANDIQHRAGRTEFQRGVVRAAENGTGLVVRHTGDQSSNRLMSFAQSNCLIEIDQSLGDLPAGSTVPVIPYWGLVEGG